MYSDGQSDILSDIDSKNYELSVFSSNDNILKINQQRSPPPVELVALSDESEVSITVELHSPHFCEDAENPPIAFGQSTIQLFFGFDGSQSFHSTSFKTDQLKASNLTILPSDFDDKVNLQPILVVLLTLIFIIGLFHLITGYRGFHNGYEKLVVPLLAKLNSSNSINEDKENESDEAREWVWLSKEQIDDRSLASKYSQRSTLEMCGKSMSRGSGSSVEENSHKNVSISYRGSEISVFISPQASVTVSVSQCKIKFYY